MDVLTHGTSEEKAAVSFQILDIDDDSIVSFKDFNNAVMSVLDMWYTMTGSQVRLSECTVRYLFNKIDENGDGQVSLAEYVHALEEKSDMFDWFDILNNGYAGGVDRPSQRQAPRPSVSDREKIAADTRAAEISGANEQIAEILDIIQSLQPEELFVPGKGKAAKGVGEFEDSSPRRDLGLNVSPIPPPEELRASGGLKPRPTKNSHTTVTAAGDGPPPNRVGTSPTKDSGEMRVLEVIDETVVEDENVDNDSPVDFHRAIRADERAETEDSLAWSKYFPGASSLVVHSPTKNRRASKAEVVKGDESPNIVTPNSSESEESANEEKEAEKEAAAGGDKNDVSKNDMSTTSLNGILNSFLSTTLTEGRKQDLVDKLKKIKSALGSLIAPEE